MRRTQLAITPDDRHPLEYLNRIDRLLVGWSVMRSFQTNAPRFAKWVRDYGPEAAAQTSSAQTFIMYGWLVFLAGFILKVSGAGLAGVIAYVFTGVCIIWTALHIPLILRSQRRYRRSSAMWSEIGLKTQDRCSKGPTEPCRYGFRRLRPSGRATLQEADIT
jgi:hypothetical protein